ncbi:helix-turn-helix domain-containing protein [Pseudonocardia spirodelae]|uniref:Helix-turn-helix domain-containing protein n=1 Tax=Pseudonocardia spirodelae TaxID=3133431 RepID=A0ABU8T0Z4_9PSEU
MTSVADRPLAVPVDTDGVGFETVAGAVGPLPGDDRLVLVLPLTGRALLGDGSTLTPDRWALLDPDRPDVPVPGPGFGALCVRFPRDRVEPRGDGLHGVAGTAVDAGPGLGGYVRDTLLALDAHRDTMGAHAAIAVRHAVDLVGVLLRTTAGVEPAPRCDLLDRIKAHVDAHLGDPDLSPAGIAAAHFVSARHLHGLFAGTGTSAAAWIRSRRVEMCRRDLADAGLADVPAAAIGSRWGFRGPSHFGQVFKRATGLTPAAYREASSSSSFS